MANNKTIYIEALKNIDPNVFEKEVAAKYRKENIYPHLPVRVPDGNAGDGGEDAFLEEQGIKFSYAIRSDWATKVKEEIEKLKKKQDIKPRTTLYHITNQKITTPAIDDFKKKNKSLIDEAGITSLSIHALNDIVEWLDLYFETNRDEKLYSDLGLSSILVGTRNLITFGIRDEDIKRYAEETIYYEKEIICKTEGVENSYSSIFDLIYNNLKNREHKHYLISADGGVGKSYEMKKAVVDIYNKSRENNEDTSFIVQVYFYDLKNFSETGNSLLEDNCPPIHSEPFYVFLDGLDELNESEQVLLKKMIRKEYANRESTYFVISGRTSSFNYTEIENIFNDKINCKISTPNTLLEIPFFRNILDELKKSNVNIKDNISLLDLMRKFYENEYGKFISKKNEGEKYTNKESFELLVDILAKFAFKIFEYDNPFWQEEDIKNLIKSENTNDKKDELEFFMKDACWLSNNGSQYSFSHKIYQEYLIAFHLFKSINDEIPEVFLAGEKKQIIKDKYSNIFALWLQLLNTDFDKTSRIKNEAIKLLCTIENIEILFMCDIVSLGSENSYSIFKYIIEHLVELPFLGWKSKQIASIFSICDNKEKKNELINILIEKTNEKIDSNVFSTYIRILASILESNDLELIDVNKITNILESIINTIEKSDDKNEKYKIFKHNILELNYIIKQFDSNFNAYKYIVKEKNINIDDSDKREFQVRQIMHDFINDLHSHTSEDIIKKYHEDIISIIVDLASRFSGSLHRAYTPPTNITDDYEQPHGFSLDYPASSFEFFLDKFIEQNNTFNEDKKMPEEIPNSLRTFILDAIEKLIDECEIGNLIHNSSRSIFRDMFSILIRISHNLTKEENKRLQNLVFSKFLYIENYKFNNYIFNIPQNISDEYRKDWFNNFISILDNRPEVANDYFLTRNILFSIMKYKENNDVDLDYHLEIIKEKYDLKIDNFEYIYKYTLRSCINDKLLKKYEKDYDYFWKSLDQLNKRKEELLINLKQTAEDNISKEINCLFDKDIFKHDGLEIFDIIESMSNTNYFMDCHYLSIKANIEHSITDIKDLKQFGSIDKYPNQIIVDFLQQDNNISKSDFEKWIDTPGWEYYRFEIIIETFNKRHVENGNDSKTDYYPYQEILTQKIDQIKEELSKNIENINIGVKLNLYFWFQKNNKFDIELTNDDIYDFIQCINREAYHYSLIKENPFKNLENLLNENRTMILEACIRYINHLVENKEEIIENTTVATILNQILFYLKINNKNITNIHNINDKIIAIFLYALEKNKYCLCQELLAYFEDETTEEKKELERKIDKLITKDYIYSLNQEVYNFLVDRLLKYNKDSFQKTYKILKELFNELNDNNELKYTIAEIILDKNSDVLSWFIEYFINKNGAIKNNHSFNGIKGGMLSECSFDDAAINDLLRLLNYAHEQNPILERRKILSNIALSWLYNSSKNEKTFKEIKIAVEKIIKKSDYFESYIKNTRWLINLEEKVYNK